MLENNPEYPHQCLARLAADSPDKAFIFETDGDPGGLSYKTLMDKVLYCVTHLQSEGVKKGDIIAISSIKRLDYFIMKMACSYLGAIYTPFEEGQSDQDIKDKLDYLQEGFADRFSTHPRIHRVSQQKLNGRDVFAQCNLASAPLEAAKNPEDFFYLMHSSGTTGKPKPIANSYGAFIGKDNRITAHAKVMKVDDEDCQLCVLNPIFDASLMEELQALYAGIPAVFVPIDTLKSFSHELPRQIEEIDLNPTILIATPAMLEALNPEDMPYLKKIVTMGSAVQTKTLERWFMAIPGLKIYNGCGHTEHAIAATMYEIRPDHIEEDKNRLDNALSGVKLYLQPLPSAEKPNPEAREIKENHPDSEYELIEVGPYVGSYIMTEADFERHAHKFCKVDVDGKEEKAFCTGIHVEKKNDQLMFRGRIDNSIKRNGGVFVSLEDVEARLKDVLKVNVVTSYVEETHTLYAFIQGLDVTEKMLADIKNMDPRYRPDYCFCVEGELPTSSNDKKELLRKFESIVEYFKTNEVNISLLGAQNNDHEVEDDNEELDAIIGICKETLFSFSEAEENLFALAKTDVRSIVTNNTDLSLCGLDSLNQGILYAKLVKHFELPAIPHALFLLEKTPQAFVDFISGYKQSLETNEDKISCVKLVTHEAMDTEGVLCRSLKYTFGQNLAFDAGVYACIQYSLQKAQGLHIVVESPEMDFSEIKKMLPNAFISVIGSDPMDDENLSDKMKRIHPDGLEKRKVAILAEFNASKNNQNLIQRLYFKPEPGVPGLDFQVVTKVIESSQDSHLVLPTWPYFSLQNHMQVMINDGHHIVYLDQSGQAALPKNLSDCLHQELFDALNCRQEKPLTFIIRHFGYTAERWDYPIDKWSKLIRYNFPNRSIKIVFVWSEGEFALTDLPPKQKVIKLGNSQPIANAKDLQSAFRQYARRNDSLEDLQDLYDLLKSEKISGKDAQKHVLYPLLQILFLPQNLRVQFAEVCAQIDHLDKPTGHFPSGNCFKLEQLNKGEPGHAPIIMVCPVTGARSSKEYRPIAEAVKLLPCPAYVLYMSQRPVGDVHAQATECVSLIQQQFGEGAVSFIGWSYGAILGTAIINHIINQGGNCNLFLNLDCPHPVKLKTEGNSASSIVDYAKRMIERLFNHTWGDNKTELHKEVIKFVSSFSDDDLELLIAGLIGPESRYLSAFSRGLKRSLSILPGNLQAVWALKETFQLESNVNNVYQIHAKDGIGGLGGWEGPNQFIEGLVPGNHFSMFSPALNAQLLKMIADIITRHYLAMTYPTLKEKCIALMMRFLRQRPMSETPYPLLINEENKAKEFNGNYLDTALAREQNLLIFAGAGSGKSYTLYHWLRQKLDAAKEGDLPIIYLNFDQTKACSVLEALHDNGFSVSDIEEVKKQHYIVIIDGFHPNIQCPSDADPWIYWVISRDEYYLEAQNSFSFSYEGRVLPLGRDVIKQIMVNLNLSGVSQFSTELRSPLLLSMRLSVGNGSHIHAKGLKLLHVEQTALYSAYFNNEIMLNLASIDNEPGLPPWLSTEILRDVAWRYNQMLAYNYCLAHDGQHLTLDIPDDNVLWQLLEKCNFLFDGQQNVSAHITFIDYFAAQELFEQLKAKKPGVLDCLSLTENLGLRPFLCGFHFTLDGEQRKSVIRFLNTLVEQGNSNERNNALSMLCILGSELPKKFVAEEAYLSGIVSDEATTTTDTIVGGALVPHTKTEDTTVLKLDWKPQQALVANDCVIILFLQAIQVFALNAEGHFAKTGEYIIPEQNGFKMAYDESSNQLLLIQYKYNKGPSSTRTPSTLQFSLLNLNDWQQTVLNCELKLSIEQNPVKQVFMLSSSNVLLLVNDSTPKDEGKAKKALGKLYHGQIVGNELNLEMLAQPTSTLYQYDSGVYFVMDSDAGPPKLCCLSINDVQCSIEEVKDVFPSSIESLNECDIGAIRRVFQLKKGWLITAVLKPSAGKAYKATGEVAYLLMDRKLLPLNDLDVSKLSHWDIVVDKGKHYLLAATYAGVFNIYEIKVFTDGAYVERRNEFHHHNQAIIVLAQFGDSLLSVSQDQTLRVWPQQQLFTTHPLNDCAHRAVIRGLVINNVRDTLATITHSTVYLWKIMEGHRPQLCCRLSLTDLLDDTQSEHRIKQLLFSNDDTCLAVLTSSGYIIIIELATLKVCHIFVQGNQKNEAKKKADGAVSLLGFEIDNFDSKKANLAALGNDHRFKFFTVEVRNGKIEQQCAPSGHLSKKLKTEGWLQNPALIGQKITGDALNAYPYNLLGGGAILLILTPKQVLGRELNGAVHTLELNKHSPDKYGKITALEVNNQAIAYASSTGKSVFIFFFTSFGDDHKGPLELESRSVGKIAINPAADLLLAGDKTGAIFIIYTGNRVPEENAKGKFTAHDGAITGIVFISQSVVCSVAKKELLMWNAMNCQVYHLIAPYNILYEPPIFKGEAFAFNKLTLEPPPKKRKKAVTNQTESGPS